MKKLISSGIGVLMLLSPLVASADVASQIAALRTLIQQLIAQIAQLQAERSTQSELTSCHTFNTDIQFGDAGSALDQAPQEIWFLQETLKKEGFAIRAPDSDGRRSFGESTRAAVIKFQAKYGIKQTGYVGPLTRAQLNRLYGCGAYGARHQGDAGFGPEGRPIEVPGMSKYTDSNFGFSFWYPSGWTVQTMFEHSVPGIFGTGTEIVKEYRIVSRVWMVEDANSSSHGIQSITIDLVNSPTRSVSIPYNGMGEGRLLNTFYFDTALHTWMAKPLPGSIGSLDPVPADVSNNTMGGLHIFGASGGHGSYANIVPLSARHFLVISGHRETADESNNTDAAPLIKTILATDPAVATPVSAAEQVKVIEAAKEYYAK